MAETNHHRHILGMVQQEVRNNLSSPESPSMNNTPFGSSMGPSSRGPPGRSSAFSQSSAPPHATNGHHFDSTTSPADSTAARPSELDRIDSGFTEPGTDFRLYIQIICSKQGAFGACMWCWSFTTYAASEMGLFKSLLQTLLASLCTLLKE